MPINARQTAHRLINSGEFQPDQWAAAGRSLYSLSIGTSPYEIGRNKFGRHWIGRQQVRQDVTLVQDKRNCRKWQLCGLLFSRAREPASFDAVTAGPGLAAIIRLVWPGL